MVLSQFYGNHGSQAHKKATELFEREAQRLKQLREHIQIPNLYAYFKEGEYLYLVQQFIEGQNLLQELKQQEIFDEAKIRNFLNYLLLSVLIAIHQQQVIHRDIKPENIIRRHSDGRLVLIDFGVAKQKTESIKATVAGTIIGSLGYAPIEQMQLGKVFPSSDMYSLGITYFHLLIDISPSSLWMELLLMPSIRNIYFASKVAQEVKGRKPLFASEIMYSATTLQNGKDLEGIVLPVYWHRDANKDNPFAKNAFQLWNVRVNQRTAGAYDALQAIIAGLKQDNSREGSQKVLSNPNFSTFGATGIIQFSPSGERQGEAMLVKIERCESCCSGSGYDFALLNKK